MQEEDQGPRGGERGKVPSEGARPRGRSKRSPAISCSTKAFRAAQCSPLASHSRSLDSSLGPCPPLTLPSQPKPDTPFPQPVLHPLCFCTGCSHTWGVLPSALLIPIKPVRHPPPREVPGHHPRTVLSLQGTADVQMPCRTSAGAKVGKAIWKRTYLGCFTPLSCSSLLRANVSSCGGGGPQVAPSINTTHSIYHTVL